MKSMAEQFADALIEAGPTAVTRLMSHLRERGLLPILPAIARALEARERREAERFVAASARPLSAETRREIEALIPRDAELTEVADKTLVGGMRLRLGDDLYDGSLKGQLEHLRHAMRS